MSTDLSMYDKPVGPLRDREVIAINGDHVDEGGFICQVGSAGDITYRTLGGAADVTETGLTAGAFINVAGIPVLLQAVRGTSTVANVIVGKL